MKEDPDRLSHGIDFLDIKNGLLAEYNTNLAYLVMKKTRAGISICHFPVFFRTTKN